MVQSSRNSVNGVSFNKQTYRDDSLIEKKNSFNHKGEDIFITETNSKELPTFPISHDLRNRKMNTAERSSTCENIKVKSATGLVEEMQNSKYLVETQPEELNDLLETVSRAGKRMSTQMANNNTDRDPDAESDGEDGSRTRTASDMDLFGQVDITDEKAWDTDLEEELLDMKGRKSDTSYDHSGKTMYLNVCRRAEVVPCSYFLRNMKNDTLLLKHQGLRIAGIRPICISLMSNTTITRLSLNDNWLGHKGGLCVLDMLKENCFLTHVDISDNHIGSSGLSILAEVLRTNTTLTSLYLSGNNLDNSAAVYIADALLITKHLKCIKLSHNNFGEEAGVALGQALAENVTLKEIDLSWNCIRRKGAIAIAQGVKNNIFLLKCNISWNGIGVEGAKALGNALKVNSTLEEIDLSNNNITAQGAVLFSKALMVNEALKKLKIGQNPMQSAGCYAIAAATLKNPECRLKFIDFSDILVNNDFNNLWTKVKEMFPGIKCRHTGNAMLTNQKGGKNPFNKIRNHAEKTGKNLLEILQKYDSIGSNVITREEFLSAMKELGVELTDDDLNDLIDELDRNDDGQLKYRCLLPDEDCSDDRPDITRQHTVI